MFTNPEQFANATRTLFNLQMQTLHAIASQTVEGMQQVAALSMTAAKDSVDGTLAAGKEMSAAENPTAAFAALQARIQPGVANATTYGSQLKAIFEDINGHLRDAADTHVAETRNTVSALIEHAKQDAKPGQEAVVEIVKTSIDNVFNGYEQVTTVTRRAVRTVEEQLAKASTLVAPSAAKAPHSEHA
jgi:phasin family protein